jgi:hypothetical protein
VQTEVDLKTGALLARNHYNTEFPDRIVFRCIRCTKSLGVTRDPALLSKKRMPETILRKS